MKTNNIKTKKEAIAEISKLKSFGHEIVFTNGCFDLLHLGHYTYLEQAKSLGDFLVVGLNSDSSVKGLKGESRPINDEHTRAVALSSLRYVDMVVVFDEPTPQHLIEALTPDILVKGGDYKATEIVGADWVVLHGGKVMTLPFVEGHSSSAIIERIDKAQ